MDEERGRETHVLLLLFPLKISSALPTLPAAVDGVNDKLESTASSGTAISC